jgi:hypothetical protein
MPEAARRRSPFAFLFLLYGAVATLVAVLEKGAQALLAQQDARSALPHSYALVVAVLNRYLRVRYFVLEHWALAILLGLVAPLLILIGVKRWLAALYRWREERSGMAFKQERYDFPRVEASLARLMAANPDVDHQVLLGIDERGQPVYLTDEARSMHLHVLGQTGAARPRASSSRLCSRTSCAVGASWPGCALVCCYGP